MTRVSLVVDARGLPDSFFADGSVTSFMRIWGRLEAGMRGDTLRPGQVIPVNLDEGRFTFEVISPPGETTVTADVHFGVVAVRERLTVREAYRCATCWRRGDEKYAPFICQSCPDRRQRVCDEHAVVLPGSLEATCPAHAPACAAEGCGQPAMARCPGPDCRSRRGWCARHAAAHSSDPRTRYCLPCLARLFPACGRPGCDGLGSVSCDHLDAAGELCGGRRCPRHARRWQVFGPHKEGLGRCDRHANVTSLSPDAMLYQIIGGCTVGKQRLPNLRGLRHVLMKGHRRQWALDEVYRVALAVPGQCPPLVREQVSRKIENRQAGWTAEIVGDSEAVAIHTEELRRWLRANGNPAAADGLTRGSWTIPREGRLGTLRVRCDPRILPLRWREAAGQQLGFDVRLEQN